ncbi:MAG TPA: sulfotransferase [Stellaceae bacterium]|nr:sulfotransferase [Stellaceae bacterium]
MVNGPVFVAGCPRSGTSALSWAIAAHPGYWSSAETHFFYYLLRERKESLRQVYELSSAEPSWLHRHKISYGHFLAHIGFGFDRMLRQQAGGRQWIDGSPENVMVGEQLLQMFPSAHMFVIVRDPRGVCLSMLNSGFKSEWAHNLAAAIREWKHYVPLGRALAAAHPDRVCEIRHEDMRQCPAAVAATIGERLGLSAPRAISEFLATTTINSSFENRSPPEAARRRDEFLAEYGDLILAETAELARAYGYVEATGRCDAAAVSLRPDGR